jgi:hypothetical protein
MTQMESFLYCPRWPRQVQLWLSLSRDAVAGVFTLNFANGNTALRSPLHSRKRCNIIFLWSVSHFSYISCTLITLYEINTAFYISQYLIFIKENECLNCIFLSTKTVFHNSSLQSWVSDNKKFELKRNESVKNFILPFICCLTFRHGNIYSNANIPTNIGEVIAVLTFVFTFKSFLMLATHKKYIFSKCCSKNFFLTFFSYNYC